MDNVGIITIPDYNNYGNRLQNYAVKQIFQKIGYNVSSLELNDPYFNKYNARKLKLFLKKYRMLWLIFLYTMLTEGIEKAQRDSCFEKFTLEYLNVVYKPEFNEKTKKDLIEKYKFFILGSDQIWHPTVNTTPYLYFAEFVNSEKRIYFAPSFGVKKLPDSYIQIVREGLKNAKNISVREKSGQEIIRSVVNGDSEVLCDPTLLIQADEWAKLAKAPRKIPQNGYIMQCFLGPMNSEYIMKIQDFADDLKKPIYKLADKRYKTGYVTGPQEFIYSVMNADFIVTDSFHTVAFSILFKKPFVVFSRLKDDGTDAGIDSRIDELLKETGLIARKYAKNYNEQLLDCNFEMSEIFIQNEKRKVNNFLCNALSKQ